MTPTISPQPKQHHAYEVLKDDETRFLLFGGGAGGGKSWLGSEWLLTNCYFYPGSKWFIGRNELSRLMKSSWITFGKVCKMHMIPKDDWNLDGKWNIIKFTNGSSIDLLDLAYKPSDPDYERFGSLEYTGGWIEEAGEVDFKAFDVLKSRVGRHENSVYGCLPPKLLLTCNPNKGWLYREIYKPDKEKRLPEEYKFIKSLYTDNKYTSEEYGKQLHSIEDQATKERLMFGNWEYDDDPAVLIKYENILDLFTNTVDYSEEKYLSEDVARFGKDLIVLMCWRGWKVYKIVVRRRQGLDATTTLTRDIIKQERIPYSHVTIDEDGVGGGVVDQFDGIRGFTANASPIDEGNLDGERPNYRSLKAQCVYKLAKRVNSHLISIAEDVIINSNVPEFTPEKVREAIIDDLGQMKAKDTDRDDKRLDVTPKDETKEHLGRSPDFGDTLMMRVIFELKPPVKKKMSQYKPKIVNNSRV